MYPSTSKIRQAWKLHQNASPLEIRGRMNENSYIYHTAVYAPQIVACKFKIKKMNNPDIEVDDLI